MLFLSWAAYAVGVIFWVLQKDYVAALAWLALVPLGWWAYIRVFPAISRYVGYGGIEDRPAVEVNLAAVKVVYYTAPG
jgi:hypothetical protein